MKKISYSLLLLVLIAGPANAATLFGPEDWEGSEADILSRWKETSCDGTSWPLTSNPRVTTGHAFSGTHALKAHYQGHQQAHLDLGFTNGFLGTKVYGGCSASAFFAPSVEIWVTYYERQEAYAPATTYVVDEVGTKDVIYLYGYSQSNRNNRFGLIPTYMYGDKGSLLLNITNTADGRDNTGNDGNWRVPDAPAWVCYEWHIKLNTPGVSNGLVEAYATNITAGAPAVRFINDTGRQIRGTNTSSLIPSDALLEQLKVYVQDGWGDIYQDLHQVSTTRVGCATATSKAAPKAPTNLTVM